MNARNTIAAAFGTILEGGFYAGRIHTPEGDFAIIVAPKAGGAHDRTEWGPMNRVPGAMSFYDGAANTKAMAEAGSKLAKWAHALTIGGFSDWYIPSRDELELCYRNLKPTTEENWSYRGDNPSSVPVGYAYMPNAPAQTEVEAFRAGGSEAFDDAYHWSSTQFAGDEGFAWGQGFGGGGQGCNGKANSLRARAVRRVAI